VGEFRKSLKQQAAVAKAPVKASYSQANYVFASSCAFVKLEA